MGLMAPEVLYAYDVYVYVTVRITEIGLTECRSETT